jgi:hypothetical protein
VYRGLVRATFERHAGLDDVLGRVARLPARTVIFDVEPLVARWDSGQDALDLGVGLVIGRMAAIPGLRVVCFATNSRRRPSVLPPAGTVLLDISNTGLIRRAARTEPRLRRRWCRTCCGAR